MLSSKEELQKYGIITNIPSPKALRNAWQRIQNAQDTKALVSWSHEDPEVLFHWLCKLFECRDAGGGVVRNPAGEYLFIYRRDRWDLPKGHAEKGEEMQETALREVMEECGIPLPLIEQQLPSSYHIYSEKGKYILKTTHWYLMSTDEKYPLKPQEEEDISLAEWIPAASVPALMKESWPSLMEVVRKALRASTH